MVTVMTLNKFVGDLGYHHLTVSSGVAYFQLERRLGSGPYPNGSTWKHCLG
jgi:hypothetical protein